MPRFFCEEVIPPRLIIEGEDAKHITKSLRMRVGENVTICCKSVDYLCEIVSISNVVELLVVSERTNSSEPNTKISLYQALPKSDKLDFIIQKSVELGVSEIVPVLTSHCVSRLSSADFSGKLPRYNKIALEAAKQSGRGIIPVVRNILTYRQAIDEVTSAKECRGVLYYEGGGVKTDSVVHVGDKQVAVFIGSEGGFSDDEVTMATSSSITLCNLGRLILRCETAPIVAMTLVLNATKNM